MPTKPNKLSQFWQELKRRKVLYFLIGYVAACFAIIEFSTITSDTFSIPENTVKLLYILATIGLPVVIILPWFIYRRKPEAISDELDANEPKSKSDKPATPENSILVLPFENMSPDPDQDYFSDGLTEEITADLSQIRDLKVISRSSAMTLKGINKRMKEIASELNVRYVLEGSVRKAEKDLRITAQLIDAVLDTHIWAEKYSGKLDDVFEIQERVSRSIAKALEIRLSPKEELKLSKRPIENIQAYEYWLKARYETFQYQKENLVKAIDYMESGLRIIGDNATLFAGLGFVYIQFYNSGLRTNEQTLKEAEKYARKAVELDSESYLGHFVFGIKRYLQGEIKESIPILKKAITYNPNHTDSIRILSFIYSFLLGNKRVGASLLEKLLDLDPYFPVNRLLPVYQELGQGNMKNALLLSESYFKDNSNYFPARNQHAFMLLMHNRTTDALQILDKLKKENPDHPQVQIFSCLSHCVLNQKEQFLELFSKELKDTAWNHSLYSWYVADCFALVNEKEKSIEWLENTVNRGFINYPFLNKYDPLLKNIRSEDRFIKLMERVRFEWENFEV
jgi:TolB-like protein